jgi:hypothetical protein
MKKFILTTLITGLLLSASVAGASAHQLTVDPPGRDAETRVVSTSWAQAHCQALAPERATANSDVIEFTPDGPEVCDFEPGGFAPGPPPK